MGGIGLQGGYLGRYLSVGMENQDIGLRTETYTLKGASRIGGLVGLDLELELGRFYFLLV